jgi:hypothetical protein
MERKEKLLVPRLNNLFKDVGHWKCKVSNACLGKFLPLQQGFNACQE